MLARILTLLILGLSALLPLVADQERFPKPEPEKAFAEFKVLQPDGAAYRVPVEDWDGARQRVASDPAWKKWVADERKAVDAWIESRRDRTDWAAGYWHDFVSPVDGSFLSWKPEIPGEETDHLVDRRGNRVELTPRLFGAWVFGFRSRHMTKIQECARLYRLTGDTRYRDWAAAQLDFYADNLEKWPIRTPPGRTSPARLSFQSLDEAVNLVRLVDAARLLFEGVEPARRQAWFDHLFKPEVELLDRSMQQIHNIAVWQRCAGAQVALLYGDEEMWRRQLDGPFGLRAQIARGITSDYLWYEQSLHYNTYIVTAASPLLTFAGLVGRSDALREEAASVQNLLLAPFVIRFPDDTLPNPSDTHRAGKIPVEALAKVYRILPTRLGLRAAAGTFNWDTLVDPPFPPPAQNDERGLPPVVSRNLESSRFALLKQGPWQVFFHYGQLDKSHAQAEALNWSATYNGVFISQDPGTVGYGSPLSKNYYRRGLNHNVPLIDGEGQTPWAPGELVVFDAAGGLVRAAQPAYQQNASAQRTLRFEGGALIDEVAVKSKSPARLGLALHLQGELRADPRFTDATDFATGRPEPFGYWKNVRAARFENEVRLEAEFARGLRMQITLRVPGEFILYHGSSPDAPPDRRTGLYLELVSPADAANFTTRIEPAAP